MDLNALQHEDPILKLLGAAQERIRDPENWCQGAYGAWKADYGALCAWGAMKWASQDEWPAVRVLDNAARQCGYGSAGKLNDSTDHPTVMAMFDRARELRMANMMEAVHASQ